MSRAALLFWTGLPLALVVACGEPFSVGSAALGVAGDDSADGGDTDRGGVLGLGGGPVVNRPTNGGATASAGQPDATNGGAPDVAGSAGVLNTAGALTGGTAGIGGAPVVVGANGCPELGGEKLVLADGYCVDENEVTAAHYQKFVDSHPNVAAQPASCVTNTSFTNNCKVTDPEKQPQRCVDWCDARAYCASVGKHLCGSSTSPTGVVPYDAPVISTDNQWYMACSHGGERAYPYGNEYDSAACWSADRPPVGALTVKSASGCIGGYEGLWDMSGGLAEWVDSCNGEKGAADACHIRGGSFTGTSDQLRCDWQSAAPRDTSSNYIGFRCCAELVP